MLKPVRASAYYFLSFKIMFSRRHPYLFSFLIFSTLVTIAVVCVLVLVTTTLKHAGLSDLIVESGGDGKVGVVEIIGVITESKDILNLIKRFREDDDIKSIVIRIDSPGGVIGPSQEIYREIRKTTPEKIIIASMGSIAASGGYYIAAATNGIVANPGTITGSIGVIMAYTNFRAILDKIGMVPVVIKSGPLKDMGSPTKDMSKEEKEVLQAFVDQAHRQFVTAIAEGRKMDIDHVKSLADGRIYTGEEAVKQGLVDRLGNFEDAIEWAGQLGGIQGSVSTVYKKKEKFSFLKYIMESTLHDLVNRMTRQDIFGGYLYSPESIPEN
jgi:protease-4